MGIKEAASVMVCDAEYLPANVGAPCSGRCPGCTGNRCRASHDVRPGKKKRYWLGHKLGRITTPLFCIRSGPGGALVKDISEDMENAVSQAMTEHLRNDECD